MTGRWSCVVLVLGLAACRTPHKNVSVYSLDDDESSAARQLRAGSDVGETVTGRMNLPNYADTETTTNSASATAPSALKEPALSGETPGTNPPPAPAILRPNPGGVPTEAERQLGAAKNSPVRFGLPPGSESVRMGGAEFSASPHGGLSGGSPPLVATNRFQQRLEIGAALPITPVAPAAPLHLQPGGGQPRSAGSTQSAARIDLSADRSPPSTLPASQSIHLSLPAWEYSAPRQTAALADLSTGRSVVGTARSVSPSVNLPVGDRRISGVALGAERPVAIPEVGRGVTGVVEIVAQPVDLAPLLAVAHDADWRERQADRQRAADTARQAERAGLEKSLQQFLQPVTK